MTFANSPRQPDMDTARLKQTAASLSPPVSQAIALLRFPLVILVLYLHTLPMMEPFAREASVFFQVSQLIGQQLARLAVPMFFICAGYLLFYRFELSVGFYQKLLFKKTHSLLIPFLLWGCFGIGLYAIGLSLPFTQTWFVNQEKLVDFWTFSGFIQSLFGIERSPLVYPLWFVRDLLIFILLSPLWWLLLRSMGWWLMLPLSLLWLMDSWWLFQPALSSTVFFTLGALCAIKPWRGRLQLNLAPWLIVSYVVLQGIHWLWPLPPMVLQLTLVIGLAALWQCALWLTVKPKVRQMLTFSAGSVFFIFASHEPLLTIFRKLLSHLLPASATLHGLLYLVLPLALTFLLYQVYRFLLNQAPGCCRVLCGGR